MRGKRRAPRPRIPWRSPWTPLACLAGALATGAIAVLGGLAKDVVLIVDGERQEVRSFAASVRELLADQGVPLDAGDLVRPGEQAPLADGVRIEVRRARPLTLTVDGHTSRRVVTATTVHDALAELDLATVDGSLSTPRYEPVPLSGMELTFYTRRRVVIVAEGSRREVSTTGRTVRQVLRSAGVDVGPGRQVSPPPRTFPEDGAVITVLPPRTLPVQQAVMGLDWDALARCLSGGDPAAYNPGGPYYGLYQFSLPMWQLVGGAGLPNAWPAEEQTYRAQLLYQRFAGRWEGQWPSCGAHLFG
ncbi:ubiquitin-like domain-containing protein [Nonomuraea sp. CA-218870]|uniref:ubiquitin-like domain-containing protein n=1 Tax=Nonomuraea sp. CA-218870 TaxID=3239998 RepID=UPI003D8B9CEE